MRCEDGNGKDSGQDSGIILGGASVSFSIICHYKIPFLSYDN